MLKSKRKDELELDDSAESLEELHYQFLFRIQREWKKAPEFMTAHKLFKEYVQAPAPERFMRFNATDVVVTMKMAYFDAYRDLMIPVLFQRFEESPTERRYKTTEDKGPEKLFSILKTRGFDIKKPIKRTKEGDFIVYTQEM